MSKNQHPIYSVPSNSKTEVLLASSKITLLYNKRSLFFCYFVDLCSIHYKNFISVPTIMVTLFTVLPLCLTLHYSSGSETKGLAQNNLQEDSKQQFFLTIYYFEFYKSLWLTFSIVFKIYEAFLPFKSRNPIQISYFLK